MRKIQAYLVVVFVDTGMVDRVFDIVTDSLRSDKSEAEKLANMYNQQEPPNSPYSFRVLPLSGI